MLAAYDADVFLASVNAMTEDGVLVNIDGNSNRVSAIAQGPKKVVFIVGMNKVWWLLCIEFIFLLLHLREERLSGSFVKITAFPDILPRSYILCYCPYAATSRDR